MTRAVSFFRDRFRPAAPAAGAPAAPRPALPSRRGARRSVAAGLGFVVLSVVGLNVLLDTVRPEWRDPEYGHRIKALEPQAAAAGPRPLVVALGSSRSQMGLDPARMGFGDGPADPVVFNLSQAGCGPVHELLNLKRLLADGVTPDYVLVEVLPPVLAGDGPAEKLVFAERLSVADVVRLEPYCDDPGDLRRRWVGVRVNPWHRERLTLLNNWGFERWLPVPDRQTFMWRDMTPGGWLPYPHTADNMPAGKRADGTAQAHAQYAPYLVNFHVADRPRRAYRELVELCRGRGVRVAFYTMPESKTFRGWYPQPARDRIAVYFAELRADGVPVFEAQGWLDDEELFADGHHLMRHGAERFSRRFGADCVGPWVRGELRP